MFVGSMSLCEARPRGGRTMSSMNGSGGDHSLRAARAVLASDPELRARELAGLGITEERLCAIARQQVLGSVAEIISQFLSLQAELRRQCAGQYRANIAGRIQDWRRFWGEKDHDGSALLRGQLDRFNASISDSLEVLPLAL